jgi:hypothetical protein
LFQRNNACNAATSAEYEDTIFDPLFERETKDVALMRREPTTIAGLYAMVSHQPDYIKEHYQPPDGPEDDINGSTTGLLVTLSRELDKIRSTSV